MTYGQQMMWRELARLSDVGSRLEVSCPAKDMSWAVISHDDVLELWDTSTGHRRTLANGSMGRVSPDGRLLVFRMGGLCSACVMELHSMQAIGRLVHEDEILSLGISDNLLVSTSHDRTAKIWNRVDCSVKHILAHDASVHTAFISKNFIVTGAGDLVVRLFCVKTGKLLRSFQGHTDRITCAAISECSSAPRCSILTGSWDMTVRVTDWSPVGVTGTTVLKHPNLVSDLKISRKGSRLLTGACDYIARLYDSESKNLVYSLQGSRGWVESIALSEDGTMALIAYKDGSVRKIDLFHELRQRLLILSYGMTLGIGRVLPQDVLCSIKTMVF